jgi:hypothetical protein
MQDATRVRTCPHCGAHAEVDWRFCAVCNKLLAARRRPAPSSNGMVLVLTIVGAVAVLVLFIAVLAGMRIASKLDEEREKLAMAPEVAGETEAALGEEGRYRAYRYTYSRDGDKTTAVFLPTMLPRGDDEAFVGAARDVIERAYGDEAYGDPVILPWRTRSGPTEVLRLDGARSTYVVVPVKEETGDVHSLVVTQAPR